MAHKKGPASVVSIDSARSGGPSPTIPGGSLAIVRKKGYVLNAHSRRKFLALVFGPMEYALEKACAEANHPKRDGWEQVVNMGRREWERKTRGLAA